MTTTLSQPVVSPRCFLISPNSVPKPRFDPNDPPSICSQTPWLCQYYDFSKSALPPQVGTDYFNCGFVARPDGDWLLVRRSRAYKHCPFGLNDIVVFKLVNGTVPTDAKPLLIRAFYSDEHFEDPRGFYHNGKTYVSCTNFIWAPRGSGAHQIICEFDDDWNLVKRYDPVYGGNGQHCYNNKRQEKNWTYFLYEDKPHLVYSASPHNIAEFTWDFRVVQRWETQPQLRWQWGELRGGTPPVKCGDEYFTFYHSSVDWTHGGGRRYFTGCYAFEAKPPFRITRYTKDPLLCGSRQDTWAPGKPLVVFCQGATLRHGEWLVTLGVNDLCSAYFCPNHSDLEKLMTPL